MVRRLRLLVVLGSLALLSAGTAWAAEGGRIEGRIVLAAEGVNIADVGPIMVYLETEHGIAEGPSTDVRPTIHQQNARFTPGFMAIEKGQTIDMPNDDDVQHNVYSTSGKNRFDLGTYDAGSTRAVTLRHSGRVDIHCSIHESMDATIFVSPSPWYARVDAKGRFVFSRLPAGRYRLKTWSTRLPSAQAFLRVFPGATVPMTLTIGAPTPK